MASVKQKTANRTNARRSTGPKTASGKAVSSRNAVRHGVFVNLSNLPEAEQAEFDLLAASLIQDLRPVGTLEHMLVEKIAVAFWRNRRLVSAESASITLRQRPEKIAQAAAAEFDRMAAPSSYMAEDIQPLKPEMFQHFQNILSEAEAAKVCGLSELSEVAPAIHMALADEAENEEHASIEDYVAADYKGDFAALIESLKAWAFGEIVADDRRRALAEIAEPIRQRSALPKPNDLERYARYQSVLDGQLFKTLRALREAQDARRNTIEVDAETIGPDA